MAAPTVRSLLSVLLLTSIASANPIDVSGSHAWQAPTAGQQRGPCPGLNALANHGYISRDGIAELVEIIPAVNEVYGMGADLATLLAVLGIVSGGAPVSLFPRVSLGGESKAVTLLLNNLLGVAGTPQGLNLTHNMLEADASPTRDDLFMAGDAWRMNLNNFQAMLAAIPDGADAETASDSMAEFAVTRLQQSIDTNPDFFYGPFTGLVGRNAGFLFITRLLANASSGELDHNTLKSFFGVTGDGANMTYQYGHERIPENWYKRASDYSLLDVNEDVLSWASEHPELLDIGGNMGAVNTFTPLDLSNLTGGLLDASKLLESNNLICFALEFVKLAAPSFTNNLFATLSQPLDLILSALSVPLLSLDCPAWDALTGGGDSILEELEQYSIPGADQGLL